MAASTAVTSAGSKIYICATEPATYTQAGFEALAWVEIGEVVSIDGEIGKTFNVVEVGNLGTRQKTGLKGSYSNGTIDLSMNSDESLPGQDLLDDANESDNNYAFKLTTPNAAVTKYCVGMVTKLTRTIGGVDDVYSASASIYVNNDFIKVV